MSKLKSGYQLKNFNLRKLTISIRTFREKIFFLKLRHIKLRFKVAWSFLKKITDCSEIHKLS